MRRVVEDDLIEDTTSQGGWMYADLFLALMVIFLATVSFVPSFGNAPKVNFGNSQGSGPLQSYSKVFPERLDIVFEGFDYKFLKNSIKEFTDSKGIAGSSTISFAQIIAGYDPNKELAQNAIKRALVFSNKIDQSDHKLLDYASTTLSSSSSLTPNRIVLQLTFATRVGVTG
jgi:hypothetical protein